MESPLDLLSRAAGLVSRSHDISPPNSGHRGLRESSCHILKLTLDNGTSRPCEEEEEEEERPDVEDKPLVPADEHNLYEDEDAPLDMSIKKVKREVSASVTEEEEEDGKPRDQLMKRKRPSVISFASQPPLAAADMDVDDHFKKSLGIDFYNTVFSSRDGDQQGSSPSEGGPSSSDSFEGARKSEVGDEPVKKLSSPSSETEPDTRPASAELENTVDDHFVKALGRSTWMKLRQGL